MQEGLTRSFAVYKCHLPRRARGTEACARSLCVVMHDAGGTQLGTGTWKGVVHRAEEPSAKKSGSEARINLGSGTRSLYSCLYPTACTLGMLDEHLAPEHS